MSHFALIVAVKDPKDLDTALAPYDENVEVPAYRDYFDNWEDAYARALSFYSENPQYKPAGLDEMNVAEVLGAYEEHEAFEDTTGDKVRYYTVSTYNPKSKWDWWVIGGRYSGRWITNSPGHPDVITGAPSGATSEELILSSANGGPKKLLDLDANRDRYGAKAAAEWNEFCVLSSRYPKARGWSHFLGQVSDTYPIAEARTDYRAQPLWSGMEGTQFNLRMDCPIDEFSVDRSVYVDRHRARANVGYALLTVDGEWIASGVRGWFGVSSNEQPDQAAYYERANAYLDSVSDDTYLIVVDCHI